MTRATRGSGIKPDIDLWNLADLPKSSGAVKRAPLLAKKYTLKLPQATRDNDLRALRRAAIQHDRARVATCPNVHMITRSSLRTDVFVSSLGVAIVMASMRDGASSSALEVEGDSGSGSSIAGSSGASSRSATTSGGSAAGGGGGGGGDGGGTHGSNGARRAEPAGILEGSSRGSCKRALGAGQGVGDVSQQDVGEERARKRVRPNSPGAGGGGGGGARGGGGGAGGRTADTSSNSGGKAAVSGATKRATRKSGVQPKIDLWDLQDLPKTRAAAKRVPSAKADAEKPPREERNDDVPALRGAAREQDHGTAEIPTPVRLFPGSSSSIAGVVSSVHEQAGVPQAWASTCDGEDSDRTTVEGDSGSSSGSSIDGSWGAHGRSPTTAGGPIPPTVHVEDCIMGNVEDSHAMAGPGQEDLTKQGDEAEVALGALGGLAVVPAMMFARR